MVAVVSNGNSTSHNRDGLSHKGEWSARGRAIFVPKKDPMGKHVICNNCGVIGSLGSLGHWITRVIGH